MTSIANRGDGNRFAQMGFNGYFPKPATTADLFNALAVLIDGGEVLQNAQPLVTRHYIKSLQPPSASPSSKRKAGGLWPEGTRVLLVEDNSINQNVALGLMEQWGLSCETALNGIEALAKLSQSERQRTFSLILMDCQMPEMDGYEATRCIRQGKAGEVYLKVPIVAMTANAMIGDRERCLASGMDDYISKPINYDQLKQVLLHWLVPSRATRGSRVSGPALAADPPDLIWDLHSLQARVGGKSKRTKVLVSLFLQQAPDYLAAMDRAIAEADSDQLVEASHALKGVSLNLGANQLGALAKELELSAKSQAWPSIDVQYQQLEAHFHQLKQKLVAHLSS